MSKFVSLIARMAVLALGLSAMAQDQTPPPAPEKAAKAPAPGPQARLKDFLKLTPEQEAKLKDFQKARQDENKAFAEQMKKLRGDMQTLRKDPKSDPAKFNGLIDQMFKLRADQAKAQFKAMKEREKIFTSEQLEKMKNARGMMMRGRMAFGQGLRRGFGQGFAGPMGGFGMRMAPWQRFVGRMHAFGLKMGHRIGQRMRMMMRRHDGSRGLRWEREN